MNYPDDIRSYDNDPRSPFYSGPECGLDGRCPECDCGMKPCDTCGEPEEVCVCHCDSCGGLDPDLVPDLNPDLVGEICECEDGFDRKEV